MNKPITYNISVGSEKPHSGHQRVCPFCHPEALTDILETQGDIIWLMNKFPVFEKTSPTVIVETADHNSGLTAYSKEKLREVVSFGLSRWLQLEKDPRFKSVIYFRNYGPDSGGSQRHPHSQIIGLEDYDYRDNVNEENFMGEKIHEDDDCYATISSYPISGMGEFNVTMHPDGCPDGFADTIQTLARFILQDFPLPCTSYNIFFYHVKRRIHAKIFPRYSASPLYMGYRITHVMDEKNQERMKELLRTDQYFGE